MKDYLIDGEILSDIADKIRENAPDTYEGNTITPEEMPTAIEDVWQAGYSTGASTNKVIDLTGRTWLWNDIPQFSTTFAYNVNFTSNGTEYTSIRSVHSYNGQRNYWILVYGGTTVYSELSGWIDEKYKTLTITGGTDVNNSDFANVLDTFAEEQIKEIDLSNLATVDKISSIDCGTSASTTFNQYGISANHDATIYDASKESVADIVFKTTLPIVAGENVTFERDEDKEVIKINATGGKAIIDVAELPTENINEEAFYRVPVGTFFYEDEKNNWTCIVVDTLYLLPIPLKHHIW